MTATDRAIRIGTRGSALAVAQAAMVASALADYGIEHETVTITTAGDRRAPDTPWGEGAFVGALEEALLDGRVDVAVHSAKDVPTDEDPRLRIGAYLPRAAALDALVLRAGKRGTLDELPPGTLVGTDSPRRRGFLLARRPDLDVRPLHGNVDTRLRRLDEGEADALVLAVAGLERLGRGDRISAVLPADVVPPAPGQGAIAVQARREDARVTATLASIDDRPTRTAVEAERALLAATGGGCRAPVGALASVDGDRLTMLAGFATLDGRHAGFETGTTGVGDAAGLARDIAARIVARRATLPGAPRVLVTRPESDSLRVAARLAELGVAAVIVPSIEVELLRPDDHAAAVLRSLSAYDWAIVTSANGARAVADAAHELGAEPEVARVRWAAVGRTSARALVAIGATDVWMPTQSNASALATELPLDGATRVASFRGSLADETLPGRLRERGVDLTELTVYRTIEGPEKSRATLAKALDGGSIEAVIFASPSAVRGLVSLASSLSMADTVRRLSAICVGTRTSGAAREAGFTVVGEAQSQDASTLAESAAEYVMGVTA